MQTKQIKKVAENIRNYTGKNGTTYIHTITLTEPLAVEGVDVLDFEYHSLEQTCKNFVAGQEATFEVEKKTNVHNGKEYTNYKIKPVKAQKPFGGFSAGGGKKYDNKDSGIITALSCLSTAANFYQQRTGDEDSVLKFAERLFKFAESKSSLK